MTFGSMSNLHKGVFLSFVSLLFVVMLLFSPFVSVFSSNVSPFVSGVPEQVVVNNEAELVCAVDTAVGSTVIALNRDIKLTWSLAIFDNKDITLTSDANGFYKLIGPNDQNTIYVSHGGVLTLDGISVTHENGYAGRGVYVDSGGTLFMYSGKISDNKLAYADGCGVYNNGAFVMSGGTISNNTAGCYGGGVCNWGGSFVMSGGAIFENIAIDSGGGVYNREGTFTMSNGELSNNWAYFSGGGVANREGTFTMSGGVISGNNADNWGGGVSNQDGIFTMSGGEISKNRAKSGGGVFNMGNFTMSDGTIFKNGVYGPSYFKGGVGFGGGVSNWEGNLELRGGKISSNTASNGGGNVYNLGDVYYFGVRDVAVICLSVVFVVVGVILFVCVFYFKKRRGG